MAAVPFARVKMRSDDPCARLRVRRSGRGKDVTAGGERRGEERAERPRGRVFCGEWLQVIDTVVGLSRRMGASYILFADFGFEADGKASENIVNIVSVF